MEIAHYIYLTLDTSRFYIDEVKLRGMYGNKGVVLSYGGGNWINFNFLMVF